MASSPVNPKPLLGDSTAQTPWWLDYGFDTPQDTTPPKAPVAGLDYAQRIATDPKTQANLATLQGQPHLASLIEALGGLSGVRRK